VRVVLDTNIVISALIWGGTPLQLLKLAREGQLRLYSSPPLLGELVRVLERDKFASWLASQDLTPAFLMQRYGVMTQLVTPAAIAPTVPTAADDDVVLATALAADANLVVSGDRDLLRLSLWRGIVILNANEAMDHLQSNLP